MVELYSQEELQFSYKATIVMVLRYAGGWVGKFVCAITYSDFVGSGGEVSWSGEDEGQAFQPGHTHTEREKERPGNQHKM